MNRVLPQLLRLAAGRVERDLTGGILRARASRVTLPRGLSVPQVEALLAACEARTVSAVRDRAVITVLDDGIRITPP